MTQPIRSIELIHARIDIGPAWCSTWFGDGAHYGAVAHDTPEYRELACRCGYQTYVPHRDPVHVDIIPEINRYMIEHEIAHSFIAQELYGEPSRVLWALAHGCVADKIDILHEEELAISLQAFTRANVLPGSSAPGFSWFRLRDKFRMVLD